VFANGTGTNYVVGSSIILTTGPRTLYANWITGITYIATYDANGAGGGAPSPNQCTVQGQAGSTSCNVTTPANTSTVPPNKGFGGWNTLATGTGTNYLANVTIPLSSNIIFYANWTATFTATYDGNGATGIVPDSESCSVQGRADVTCTVQTPTNPFTLPQDRTFGGWNTLATGTGTNTTAGYPITLTATATLYANWLTTTYYTITYHANNGTTDTTTNTCQVKGSASATTCNVDALPADTFTYTDHTFANWDTDPFDPGAIVYAPGDPVTLYDNSTNLHATWT
jgi:hypothetical protein